jgi:hypothetical protein
VPVTVVELDAIDPAGPLQIGQQRHFDCARARLTQPLDVELSNWSPAVIKMR